jgi:hypothetical protein
VDALPVGAAFWAGALTICVEDDADELPIVCEDPAVLEMISPNPR